jgi:hypothetical protein
MQVPPKVTTPFGYTSAVGDPESSIGTSRNIVFQTWRTKATVERAALMHDLIRKVAASSGQPVGVFVRVMKTCLTPQGDTRSRIQQAMAETVETTVGWAVCIESEGFWGAAARAMTAGAHALSGSPVTLKIFPKVEQGAPWLAEVMQKAKIGAPPPTAEDILAIADRMP